MKRWINRIFIVLLLLAAVLVLPVAAADAPTIEWQKTLGGTKEDTAKSIVQTSDGGYIVAGYTMSDDMDVSENHGVYDFWVVKLDSTGIMEWQKCLGGAKAELANSIIQSSDGGYVVTGFTESTSSGASNPDLWVVKLNSDGDTDWKKSLGGAESDGATSIIQTSDGGYIVAGYTESDDGDVSGFHGEEGNTFDLTYYTKWDYWVVKLDSKGGIEWQKCLGGSKADEANSIIQTSDGGYVVAGYTESDDGDVTGFHGASDYWIVKLDSKGSIVWQKCIGGSQNDIAASIIQTSDGGYIVAGTAGSDDGDVSGFHGVDDYWIVKLDSTGNMEWQKSLGGSGSDHAASITQASDGGYVVAGYTKSDDGDVTVNQGRADYWIVKLDSNGNIVWQKCIGGSQSDIANSVIQTTDGMYVVAGSSGSNDGDVSGNHGSNDYWIVKLDAGEVFVPSTVQESGQSSTGTQEASASATQAPLGLYTCLAALCIAVFGSLLMGRK